MFIFVYLDILGCLEWLQVFWDFLGWLQLYLECLGVFMVSVN